MIKTNMKTTTPQHLLVDSMKTRMSMSDLLDDLCMRFILNAPEEDFENVERLFFHIEEAHWFYTDNYFAKSKKERACLPDLSFVEFAEKLFDHLPLLAPFRHDVESYTKYFQRYKCEIPVFGAIILNQHLDKVLLIKGSNSHNWSFPKGKVNKHETELQCAIREVKEEVGFDMSGIVDDKLFISKTRNKQTTKLFIVPRVPENTRFATQTKGEIDNIKWIPLDMLASSSHGSPRKSQLLQAFLKDIIDWVEANRPQPIVQPTSHSSPPSQPSAHKIIYHQRRKQSPPRQQQPRQQPHHHQQQHYHHHNKLSCVPVVHKNKHIPAAPYGIVNAT